MRRKTRDLVHMVLAWTCFVGFSGLAASRWDGEVTLVFMRNVLLAAIWFPIGIIRTVSVFDD